MPDGAERPAVHADVSNSHRRAEFALTDFECLSGKSLVNLGTGKREEQKRYRVHCLVLEAFVSPCGAGQQCDHLNGRKGDNRLENLEWVTAKENSRRYRLRLAPAA